MADSRVETYEKFVAIQATLDGPVFVIPPTNWGQDTGEHGGISIVAAKVAPSIGANITPNQPADKSFHHFPPFSCAYVCQFSAVRSLTR